MVLIECSPGEIADKVSILKIKIKYIKNAEKCHNELTLLEPHVNTDISKLTKINKLLWDVENEIRNCEKHLDFGKKFIQLARLVYKINDKRSKIKNEINHDCNFAEQKQYTDYDLSSHRKTIGVLTHMGLGDHLVCNGMIREFIKTLNVVTYVKKQYVTSVRHMFRDVEDSVTIVPVENDHDAWLRQESNTYRSGIFFSQNWNTGNVWCDSFYENVNMDPKLLRNNFFYVRSRDDENLFYEKVIQELGSDKYIVVHEDLSRFEPLRVVSEFPIVKIGRGQFPVESDNIFDYCKVIENAIEYHGFDSSFAWLIELLELRPKQTTFMHRYIKGYCTPGKNEFYRFETR